MDWLSSSAQALFKAYIPRIKKLPVNRTLTQKDLLVNHFRLYSKDAVDVYYAPMGHVRRKAKIIIIGVTPGWTQMELSYQLARSMVDHLKTQGLILGKIKKQIAFAGTMRVNLIKMLDELRLPECLGIKSAEVLFEEKTDMVHSTSALRYPMFFRGKNYTGHAPKMLSIEIQRCMVENLLGKELTQVEKGLIVPLGKASTMAVEHLVECGIVDKKRCLFGFPHPSGANAHRVKEFEERQGSLKRKMRNWFKTNS